jgi:hypothetical protein
MYAVVCFVAILSYYVVSTIFFGEIVNGLVVTLNSIKLLLKWPAIRAVSFLERPRDVLLVCLSCSKAIWMDWNCFVRKQFPSGLVSAPDVNAADA